ncbi:MAG: CHAP domain-containing protein [Spirochaetia bacterium]|nr:CHAP domain-containing protein [Spirochaetia bacterium]
MTKRYFFHLIWFLPAFMLFSTCFLWAFDKNSQVEMLFDVPEEGSAVSVDSDEAYEKMAPVDDFGIVKKERSVIMIEDKPKISHRKLNIDASELLGESQGESFAVKAAKQAEEFLNKNIKSVNIKGKTYRIDKDCAYFVRAAYWLASDKQLDLYEDAILSGAVPRNIGSGVRLLAYYMKNKHTYESRKARVGDIIVFDNTYDKNKNRKRDDYYTHVGIVTKIRNDGTIEFVHGNISRTIKKGYINFKYPSKSRIKDVKINSYIRPKYRWERDSSRSLAGHLVRAFGGF